MVPNQHSQSFLSEAQDFLQAIEGDLLTFREDRTVTKVHQLMRAAHTIKGSAAMLELEVIQTIAHVLEDIFTAFYDPETPIDSEVENLLFQGYECLRASLMGEIRGERVDETNALNQITYVMDQLREKLGNDCFDRGKSVVLSSTEMGFDLVQSMFESSVTAQIECLATLVAGGMSERSFQTFIQTLEDYASVLQGLAESVDLLGFSAIGETTLIALQHSPESALEIAAIALADFRHGQQLVINGDRDRGGEPSASLLAFLPSTSQPLADLDLNSSLEESVFVATTEVDIGLDALFENNPPEISEQEPPSVSRQPASPRAESIRVDLSRLERLDYLAGELLIHQHLQSDRELALNRVVQELMESLHKHQRTIEEIRDWSDRRNLSVIESDLRQRQNLPLISPENSQFIAAFDPLEMDRYSDLHMLLQVVTDEAVKLSGLTESIDQLSRQSRHRLESQRRLLDGVRDDLTTARTQRMGDLLQRFPKVLEQLSSAYKKPCELFLKGTQVLIDKAVVEQLYDPLLHLVRNAFDHGIEPPNLRQQKSKPTTGRIEIHAYNQGNRTVVDVRDDGSGIDFGKVKRKAIERGLLSPDRADQLPEVQLANFLFEPGFSTADRLSDLSGRGVGLDVVRSQIQTLNGSVSVTSSPQGTTFSLQIPLSLTISKLLICQSGGLPYTIPVDAVEQVLLPQEIRELPDGRFLLRWQQGDQESFVPIVSLAALFRYPSQQISLPLTVVTPISACPVLLVRVTGGLYAISVDRVLDERELVVRPLESAIAAPPYIYGCCLLSDNRLALAIDIQTLMLYETQSSERSPQSPMRLPEQLPPTCALSQRPIKVIVVEDSAPFRQMLAGSLQRAGYQVLEAGDGVEALARLQKETVDLIVSDIEMPRMSGFELLGHLRLDPKLAKIPTVVLTSRASDKYRQMASGLGAKAFLTKPYSERELLDVARDLLSPLLLR
jgi:two-component system, chemotaxis family, sensor histidine kinase and response regulator PixL